MHPFRVILLVALVATTLPAGAPAAAEPEVEYQNRAHLLPPGLPFPEAVRVDRTLYLSGQVGLVPGKMALVPGGIGPEARQVMENIGLVLRANGLGFDDLVKCTAMLADMSEWAAFNEVYRGYFHDHFPARSAFGATGLALGARVELECTAVIRAPAAR